jgi:4-hydroxy-tetrahydrodipicolinate synthase
MKRLGGLSAFPITPSDASGRIDLGALRAVIAPLIAAGTDSIGLLGSTGSYPYFSREERRRAIEATVAQAGGKTAILTGIGALRTDDAVKLAQDARAAGAAAGLLAAVSYTPLTDDEVFEHFKVVAGESGLPICIYDNPSTTHFRFSPDLVGRIAKLPGVIAVKGGAPEPSAVASHLDELRKAVPAEFSVGYSADWNCTEALIAGCDTWYSVIGGICPRISLRIVRAAQSGDAATARRWNEYLEPVWQLFRTYSSLRVVYAIAEIKGLCTAQPPRPILPLQADARQKVAEVVAKLDLA